MPVRFKLWRFLRLLSAWMAIVVISLGVYTFLDRFKPLTGSSRALKYANVIDLERHTGRSNKFGNDGTNTDDVRDEVYLDIKSDNEWGDNNVTTDKNNDDEDDDKNDFDLVETHDDGVHESDDENIVGDDVINNNNPTVMAATQQPHFDNGLEENKMVRETTSRWPTQTDLSTDVKSIPPDTLSRKNTLKLRLNAIVRTGGQHWTITSWGNYSPSLYSPPPNEEPKQRLPQAIIIGAGKCGTRALIEFLRMHPFIVPAKAEIHFFDNDTNFAKGLGWYKAQMPYSFSNQITLEKTPSYLWSSRAIDGIYRVDSNMKLIVIIKNPVTRVVSQVIRGANMPKFGFDHLVVRENGTVKVRNESRTIDFSIYAKHLYKWMNKFPKSQFYIVDSKEFVTDPAKEIQKIEEFLQVPPRITSKNFYYNTTKGFYCMRPFHLDQIECLSDGKGKPHPKLEPALEKGLYEFYHPHNEELFKILGRRFSWEPNEPSSR